MKVNDYLRAILVAQIATLEIVGSFQDVNARDAILEKLNKVLAELEEEE